MKKKLRLLTIASIATKEKTIHYDHMQKVLGIDSIRELEDLIIEGTNNAVLKGKLDQKSKHFEVDYAFSIDKIPYFVLIRLVLVVIAAHHVDVVIPLIGHRAKPCVKERKKNNAPGGERYERKTRETCDSCTGSLP